MRNRQKRRCQESTKRLHLSLPRSNKEAPGRNLRGSVEKGRTENGNGLPGRKESLPREAREKNTEIKQ